MLERLHIGTSGWSYQHWCGRFYPETQKSAQFLEYYATQFSCVELNASFYRTPNLKTVEGWLRRTPENFRFCVKMSQQVTHRQRLADTNNALKLFLATFAILQPKLGPFLIQLPPSLQFERERAQAFYEQLQSYDDFRFALEPRHKSWFTDDSLQLLQANGIGLVFADSGGVFPQKLILTADFAYLRFHGPRGLYYSPYSNDELRQYANMTADWLKDGKEVWGFFNNDANAFAVYNALDLIALVRDFL